MTIDKIMNITTNISERKKPYKCMHNSLINTTDQQYCLFVDQGIV
jgi:hypothetical protein